MRSAKSIARFPSMAYMALLLIQLSAHAILLEDLQKALSGSHRPISYNQANQILFTELNKDTGIICSVYSPSKCIAFKGVPSAKIMNIEHTWPQSEGANGTAKSDLHHLFPTTSQTNSMRSNLPFCEVKMIKWAEDQSFRGYNEFQEHCFQPPSGHQGNVARSLFYFSIRYGKPIDSHQEATLRHWHSSDPVDKDEVIRNNKIESFQGNRNLFIDQPELVEEIHDF